MKTNVKKTKQCFIVFHITLLNRMNETDETRSVIRKHDLSDKTIITTCTVSEEVALSFYQN